MKLLRLASVLALAPAVSAQMIVTSWNNGAVYEYDATTGALLQNLVPPGSGGLMNPHSAAFGPDGNLYVSSFGNDRVLRYDGQSGASLGAFVTAGLGGLNGPTDAFFGPDMNFYVTSLVSRQVLRYDGQTGAFLDVFIDSAQLTSAETGNFGPDGHFYLATGAGNGVNRYDGQTGDFIDAFVPSGSGNLSNPHDLAFGPDGNLYVTSFGNNRVKRYDGTTGAFINNFITPANGLSSPHGIDFRPDGNVYIASFNGSRVQRYNATTGDYVDDFVPQGASGLTGGISVNYRDDDELNLSASANQFRVYGLAPGETVQIFLGVGNGMRIPPTCPMLTFRIQRSLRLGTVTADAGGVANLTYNVPPALSGSTFRIQAAALSSCRLSGLHNHTLP